MRSYFIKTPGFIMRFFSKYTWRLPVNSNEIFLTFDDGPTPEITEFVLSELKKYNAKATFFCIGKNIKNNLTLSIKLFLKDTQLETTRKNTYKVGKPTTKNI